MLGNVGAHDVELLPEESGGFGWEFTITLPDGSRRLAHELATEALQAWARIVKEHGLADLPPSAG